MSGSCVSRGVSPCKQSSRTCIHIACMISWDCMWIARIYLIVSLLIIHVNQSFITISLGKKDTCNWSVVSIGNSRMHFGQLEWCVWNIFNWCALISCVACVEPDFWPAREHFCVRNQPLSINVVGPVPCFAYYGRASPPWAWDTAKPPHSTRRPRFPHPRSSMPQDQWNAKSHRNTFLSSSRPSLNRGNLNRSHRPGPKSTSLKDLLSLIIMTLSPLMSLWTTPVRWMYVITCAICFITWAANSWGIADVPSWGCP